MVRAIYKRVFRQPKCFHQIEDDECFFSAREGIVIALQDMEQTAESSQARLHLGSSEEAEEGILVKREASVEVASSEQLGQGLVEKREAFPQVFATLELQEQFLEKREASPHITNAQELQEGLLEQREVSPEVSLDEKAATMQTTVTKGTSLARLEANVTVYVDDGLEALQQEEVEASETEKSLVQDCDVKKGVLASLRGLWKRVTLLLSCLY
ncbi:uncharacterized protein LOC120806658 [Xiphias gladius]|uniref:uncharacterized protein LOC120806658 n=1 Tax=Xiphias gladius TaxID=8245 RepID=UPI001A9852C6|nr:uncharacterized protein LOC120806658 [Xiphias gladius]XP_040013955.1 uncharacterized protein LOC120806658 [Xiphias gladius]XP_040013956.1 uncharacterized protein LOC120806658 [Xiphias gladius]XP_040013957.1 uncharacterized protein LOC120806658 [Xiphias gladius]